MAEKRRLKAVPQGSKPSIDPLSMDSGEGYDPDEIYVRSTDGHGHSVNMQTRIAPEIAGEIAKIVQSGLIPDYNTSAIFIRDAIIHRLHYVDERLPELDIGRRVSIEMRLSRVQAERRQIADLKRIVVEMKELCEDAIGSKDWEALARAVEQCEDMLEVLRDPYKQEVRDIKNKYARELRTHVNATSK